MGRFGTVVVGLGVLTILIGAIVVIGYFDAQDRADRASEEGALGGLAALDILLEWMSNALGLLILNLFVTGAALVAAGLGLRRLGELEARIEAAAPTAGGRSSADGTTASRRSQAVPDGESSPPRADEGSSSQGADEQSPPQG